MRKSIPVTWDASRRQTSRFQDWSVKVIPEIRHLCRRDSFQYVNQLVPSEHTAAGALCRKPVIIKIDSKYLFKVSTHLSKRAAQLAIWTTSLPLKAPSWYASTILGISLNRTRVT